MVERVDEYGGGDDLVYGISKMRSVIDRHHCPFYLLALVGCIEKTPLKFYYCALRASAAALDI